MPRLLLVLLLAACAEGSDLNGSNPPPIEDPDADGDGLPASVDCDDTRADVRPAALEICGDGVDQDCSGADLPCASDADGDGARGDQDCDDGDPSVYPGAPEVPYDGVDQDCDGADLVDADGDGHAAVAAGGPDCDDGNAAVYPGAPEPCEDGVDHDCSGADAACLEGDADRDGFVAAEDCDDGDAAAHPGAPEIPLDGVDQDCDGDDVAPGDPLELLADGFGRSAAAASRQGSWLAAVASSPPGSAAPTRIHAWSLGEGGTGLPVWTSRSEGDYVASDVAILGTASAHALVWVEHIKDVWERWNQDLRAVYALRLSESGAPLGEPILVDGDARLGDLQLAHAGQTLAIAWNDRMAFVDEGGVLLRSFFLGPAVAPGAPALASDGQAFAVAWLEGSGSSVTVRARRHGPDGMVAGDVHTVAGPGAIREVRLSSAGEHHLLVWLEGTGHVRTLHARALSRELEPLSEPVALAPEVSTARLSDPVLVQVRGGHVLGVLERGHSQSWARFVALRIEGLPPVAGPPVELLPGPLSSAQLAASGDHLVVTWVTDDMEARAAFLE